MTDGRTEGRTDERTDGRTDGQTYLSTDGGVNNIFIVFFFFFVFFLFFFKRGGNYIYLFETCLERKALWRFCRINLSVPTSGRSTRPNA